MQNLEVVQSRARCGLVLVCQECSKRCGQGRLRKLEAWLADELKEHGLKKQLDLVHTSCLGYCPKERVAIVLTSSEEPRPQRPLLVEPREGRKALWGAMAEYFRFRK